MKPGVTVVREEAVGIRPGDGQRNRAGGRSVARPQGVGANIAWADAPDEKHLIVEKRQIQGHGGVGDEPVIRLPGDQRRRRCRPSIRTFRWPCRSSPKDFRCRRASSTFEKNNVWQHPVSST